MVVLRTSPKKPLFVLFEREPVSARTTSERRKNVTTRRRRFAPEGADDDKIRFYRVVLCRDGTFSLLLCLEGRIKKGEVVVVVLLALARKSTKLSITGQSSDSNDVMLWTKWINSEH